MSPREREAMARGEASQALWAPSGASHLSSSLSASSMTDRYYRPELDVLRCIAFLFVFFNHCTDWAPISRAAHPFLHALSRVGWYGVPVFFLLSAFLIVELLRREREQTGTIRPGAFYARRVLRIWPLYFVVFFGLAALTPFMPGTGTTDPLAWLAFTLFSGNWYICLKGWLTAPISPLWSLSVEEQFYLAIPLLVRFGGMRALKITSAILIAIAYLWIAGYAWRAEPGFSSQWTNSFVQFQFFAAGALLALHLQGRTPTWRLPLRVLVLATALACWLAAFQWCGVLADGPFGWRAGDPHPSVIQSMAGWLLILAGSLLMLLGLLGMPVKRLALPLVQLGRISYGLYMLHAMAVFLLFNFRNEWLTQLCERLQLADWRNVVAACLALGLTVVMAMLLSYRFLERPFLRMKHRFTAVPVGPKSEIP